MKRSLVKTAGLFVALICFGTEILFVNPAMSQTATPPSIPQMTESLVLRADFGDGDADFGFSGLKTSVDRYRPVECFAVTDTHIFMVDGIRDEIKVFSADGTFQYVINPEWNGVTLPVRDIAVSDGKIHLLVEIEFFPTKPDPDTARYELVTFRTDGHPISRETLEIPGLGYVHIPGVDQPVPALNSVRLSSANGTAFVYNTETQLTYKVDPLGSSATSGQMIGMESVVKLDTTVHAYQLRNKEGTVTQAIEGDGDLVATSEGGFFAIVKNHYEDSKPERTTVTVYDRNGNSVGQFDSPRRDWRRFEAPFELYRMCESSVYEVRVDGGAGLSVVRWRP